MYYDYGYGYDYGTSAAKTASNMTGALIWIIIAAVLALVGGILAYYLFVKPETKQNNKFLNYLKDFLRFNTLLIESILKVFYIIATLFVTLSSFAWFATGFIGVIFFLLQVTLGNVVVRKYKRN